MKLKERIYCIEGHWDYGKREVEPSVEPILQAIQSMGYWEYARRDCATVEEMKFWLSEEWNKRCKEGSILYLATHGSAGEVSLSDRQSMTFDDLESWGLDLTNCIVHFGGCRVLNLKEGRIKQFMESTRASAVSGYGTWAGWADAAPALALELVLFSSIGNRGVRFHDGRSAKPKLQSLAERLRKGPFKECDFRLHTWWD